MADVSMPRMRALLMATFGRDLAGIVHAYFIPRWHNPPLWWTMMPDDQYAKEIRVYNAAIAGCFEIIEHFRDGIFYWGDHLVAACYNDYPAIALHIAAVHELCDVSWCLEEASICGRLELAHVLLDANGHPDRCFEAACAAGHREIAMLALRYGATVAGAQSYGRLSKAQLATAIECAAASTKDDSVPSSV